MGLGDKIIRKILIEDLNRSLEDGIVFLYEGVIMAYNKGQYYTSFYLSETGMNINDYQPYPVELDYMETEELKRFVGAVKKSKISLSITMKDKNGDDFKKLSVNELLPI